MPDAQYVLVVCKSCQARLHPYAHQAGTRITCPDCGQKLVVPVPKRSELPSVTWPQYDTELFGFNDVRVRNPNDFDVRVGIRSGWNGKDFVVPAFGVETVGVPNGQYDIYFRYSCDPGGLYRGDSFCVSNSHIEIQIVQVPHGNYHIRKVR